MSVDLVTTMRLLHKVFGFLADQSADQLRNIAEGRASLALTSGKAHDPQPAAEQPTVAIVASSAKGRTPSSKATKTAKPANGTLSDEEVASIASRLRGFSSVDDGASYLAELRIGRRPATKAHLIKVGAELGLSLSSSSTLPQLQQRLINHAIGAKQKYAGLARW